MVESLSRLLKRVGACEEAVEWSKAFKTDQAAWRACERGDHMLWILAKQAGNDPSSPAHRKLTLAACACARLALKHVPNSEDRPIKAIKAAEDFASGKKGVAIEDVREAARQSRTAAYVADVAAAAAYVADAAADAAYVAAYVAAAAAAAARAKCLKRCAAIVRRFYPKCPKRAS